MIPNTVCSQKMLEVGFKLDTVVAPKELLSGSDGQKNSCGYQGVASHADIIRASSRVPSPQTSFVEDCLTRRNRIIPTYPSPKTASTLTSNLGQNVGLGKG